MKFKLALPPSFANLANQRRNPNAVRRERKAYMDMARSTIMAQARNQGHTVANTDKKMSIRVLFYVGNFMDWDNMMARCKMPVDCLVKEGILVDDKEKWLYWLGFPRQHINRKEPRIELELTELENGTQTTE